MTLAHLLPARLAPAGRRRSPLRALVAGLALGAALAGCNSEQQADTTDDAARTEAAEAAAADDAAAAAVSTPPAPEAPRAPEAPAMPAPAPTPAPGTDAVVVSQQATATMAAPEFDARSFAGVYTGSTTRLDIGAEGQFLLDDSGQSVAGSWTLQPGGKTIVLDPDSKSEPDRLLQLEADGSVRINGSAPLRRQ